VILGTAGGITSDAAGSIILFLQPRIAAWQARRDRRLGRAAAAISGAGVAVYNGYFTVVWGAVWPLSIPRR
jgi:hypothetical protein